MIKGIIFDNGGVRESDTEKVMCRKFAKVLGKSYASVKKVFTTLDHDIQTRKIDNKEFCETLTKKLGANVPIEKLENMLLDVYAKNSRFFQDVDEIVAKLRKAGYNLAILSNIEPILADFNKRRKIYDGFDVVVLSCDVRMRKPDPKIFRLVLKKLSLKAEECFFVDDKIEHVRAARKLGIHAILFKNSSHLERELRKLDVKF
jgi:epoxide hydrolase-like predicted phosphatase